jgi:hypothetical protein
VQRTALFFYWNKSCLSWQRPLLATDKDGRLAIMVKNFLHLLLCSLLCACILTPQNKDELPRLSGKVSLHSQGVRDIEVSAWPTTGTSLAGKTPYHSSPSTTEGTFALTLPAGDYYLLARGKNFFSFYGRNPVTIPPQGVENLKIGLVPLPATPNIASVTIEEGISGEIVNDSVPLAGAVVYAYTDLTSNLKGMGYAISSPSDENGIYELSLPAGTYYLLARMRKDGRMAMGPLRPGDYSGYAPDNPVRVSNGRVSLVSIPVLEVPEKIDLLSSSLFGQTSLRGRVLNKERQPVAGVRAILYGEAQMLNRPDHVSQPSNEQGDFVLSFPHGGTYYLAARQQLGGAPAPGELYGTYDVTPDHSLQIKTGEQKDGVVVVVEEMW